MTPFTAEHYLTHSLRQRPEGIKAARIIAHSIAGVEPGRSLREHLALREGTLLMNGQKVPLDSFQRVFLVGFGKASLAMSQEAARLLDDRLTEGIVVSKDPAQLEAFEGAGSRMDIHLAGHPLPDERGVAAAERVMTLLRSTEEGDLVIFLISGGGSSLLTAPVPGVDLEEIIRLNEILLGSGATIQEINTVRKHLSRVKGGHLARLAAPSTCISLILSDVIGDPVEMIASGPTVPDPTTFADALDVIHRYHLESSIPSAVLAYLKNGSLGKAPETPKADDPSFKDSRTVIIGNNRQAAQAGLNQARAEGFNTLHLTSAYQGEAREVGRFLAGLLRDMANHDNPLPRPACLIAGGEATVTLRTTGQKRGTGGRNQELALSAVGALAGLRDAAIVSVATDGDDGPTDAAGAVVTGETYQRGLDQGLHPQKYLDRHDAYTYFQALDDLLKPGLTGTNVNDLIYLFTF